MYEMHDTIVNWFRHIIRCLTLFAIFGGIYYLIETVYKYPNPSHWTMAVVGAFSGVMCGLINEYIPWEMPLPLQCGVGMVYVTAIEAVSGYILNVKLNLGIWDYSQVPFNFFHHQCCLPFCAAWFVLAGVAIVIDDWLRYWLFGEEKPHYRWWW